MTGDVTCISESVTLSEAARVAFGSPQSVFPVVDGAGNYKGIVSILDLFRPCFPFHRDGVYPDLKAIFADSVGSLVRRETETVHPTSTIAEVAEVMLTAQLQDLPVVEGDRVVGVVFARDVVRVLCAAGAS